ncbi:PINIT domain-containing protein [Crepidotus variabilis]|uniref:PINIT domain-containing protein n=1 Tax=Crepidotus variabilis TaxID=179855 RepID=A0A9P6ESN5_9AGAR|nr:PINIT domain-containing protein [Crepidotus variabilis]
MATTEAWIDFDQIRHSIKNNTVDKLKQILTGLNDECGMHLAKSGKKQELIDRIVETLDQSRRTNNEDRYTRSKAVVYQVRNTGHYTPSNRALPMGMVQSASASHASFDPPKMNAYSAGTSAGTSSIAHYDPYAPPRRPTTVSAPVASSSTTGKAFPIRFRESPFFSIEQAVSSVVECPESTSATDRRSANLTFTLTNDQITKLKTAGTMYQLRLFCTSSIFFAGISAFKMSPMPCPIEFPPTCEVRINNTAVQANLKGLKKKPGTAPPPDITTFTRLSGSTKVDMVYVNSQQPVQSKKFFMIVMLVEATTTDALVSKLKTTNYRSAQDIKQNMLESLNEDDDIIAGPQKMSLRCPLTFVRVSTPCRSEKCVHSQCFDATSWFTMMEQTTTWLCPVCERVLDHKDLIIDGYFDEILKATDEDVEDVIVEADGEWHTSDGRYASAGWKAAHPPKSLSPTKVEDTGTPAPLANGTGQVNGKGKAPEVEIFILDSDEDDDEGRVQRELSYASSSRTSYDTIPATQQSQGGATVIDLTLDSDEEETPPPPVNNYGKRKASEANIDSVSLPEQLWKKGRIDSSRILPAPRPSGPISNGMHPPMSNHRPAAPLPYSSSMQGHNLPPVLPPPSYGRSGSANSQVQLPPISSSFTSRQSGSSPHNTGWSS